MFDNLDNGFFDAIKKHAEQEKQLSVELEKLPFRYEKFTAQQINKLLEVVKKLNDYQQTNSQKIEDLNGLISYLDSLDMWKSKFRTGAEASREERDSIYYITENNISLRLKVSELCRGLRYVIQPFMENIVFLEKEKPDAFYPSEKSVLHSTPLEYSSVEFHALQKQTQASTDYISCVPKFYKTGKLYFVGKPKNLFHEHSGSEINQIFF